MLYHCSHSLMPALMLIVASFLSSYHSILHRRLVVAADTRSDHSGDSPVSAVCVCVVGPGTLELVASATEYGLFNTGYVWLGTQEMLAYYSTGNATAGMIMPQAKVDVSDLLPSSSSSST